MISDLEDFFEEIVEIYGANDTFKGHFARLSTHTFVEVPRKGQVVGDTLEFNEQQRKSLQFLEKYVDDIFSRETKVKPMKVHKDGKVKIEDGMVAHRAFASDLKKMMSFSKAGILASEWFGQLESEHEGRFCTFVTKVKTFEHQISADMHKKMYVPTSKQSIIFFFDEKNPTMKELMANDYFGYIHKVKTGQDVSHYPENIKELLDEIIAPLSPAGVNHHKKDFLHFSAWLAIPGGIPPYLINGLCIHSANKDLLEQLEKIQEMFPNATIFDEKQNVYQLDKSLTTQSKKEQDKEFSKN